MENATVQKNNGYGKRPLWQWVILYLVIAGVLYGLLYYFVLGKKSGYNNNPPVTYQQPTATPAVTQSIPTVSPASSESAGMSTVVGKEFAFTPSTITVKNGQPVQITFKNSGTYPHNLSISELNIKTKTIQPGEEDTITFTPIKAGQFTFICTVPGHADQGMKGTLIVQ